MKVTEILHLNSKYSFEAPIYTANSSLKNTLPKILQESTLDLISLLAPKPENLFLVRVGGDSMIEKKIFHGDILIADKKQEPKENDVVISSLNGDLTVKIFAKSFDKAYLISANQTYLPIEISPHYKFEIQGVVKHIIRIL